MASNAMRGGGQGTLYITIEKATLSHGTDLNGLADPYVIVKNVKGLHLDAGQKWKTKIIKKTLKPEWYEGPWQSRCDWNLQHLSFAVMDYDLVGKHDRLGQAKLFVEGMTDGKEHRVELEIKKGPKGGSNGTLVVNIRIDLPFSAMKPGMSAPIKVSLLSVGMGWYASKKKAIDLDLSAVVFDASGKDLAHIIGKDLKNRNWMKAIRHLGDCRAGNEGSQLDAEVINIDFTQIPPEVSHIALMIRSDLQGVFDEVKSAYVRAVEMGKHDAQLLAFSRLTNITKEATGVLAAVLRRDPSGWWIFHDIEEPLITQDVMSFVRDCLQRLQ